MTTRLKFCAALTVAATTFALLAARSPLAQAPPDAGRDGLDDGASSLQEVLDAVDPAIRAAFGPILVTSVERIRDDALAAGSREIPAHIRDTFDGHVPERILSRVRWRSDDGDASLERAVFLLRDTRALTVDHVILFANDEAAASVVLWAHELHHVVQYDAWGVEGFVTRYLADYDAIEHEANEFLFRWRDATRALE